MTKLNQIVAIEKGEKNKAREALTVAHRKSQQESLFLGLSRTYLPKDEEGEQLPPELQNVQLTWQDAIRELESALTRMLDVSATKDWANCTARAHVKVGTQVVLEEVPVTYLLFLEKQLVDVRTFISKIPTLDPAQTWRFDENKAIYVTEAAQTTRTKKVLKNHIKYEATEEHPAQVETYTEDVVVGTWDRVLFSGAIPAAKKKQLMGRINDLIEGVKFAREEANDVEITDVRVAKAVFEFVFQ